MSEDIKPTQEPEVPQIDSKEEAVGYAIKNYKKTIALILVFTVCLLAIIGGGLFLVSKSGTKVTTPIGSVEKVEKK